MRIFNNLGNLSSLTSPFGDGASKSAPIVFADGGVLAVDQQQIGYTPPSHNVWVTDPMLAPTGNEFNSAPISPALVQGNYAFVATGCTTAITPNNCGAAVFKMPTTFTFPSSSTSNAGFFTETATDSMQVGGVQYGTSNSPGTDSVNNVVYVSAAQVVGPSASTQPGALMRFQMDSSGNITSRTQEYTFPGHSGASPVVVPGFHYTPPGSTTVYTGTAVFFDGTTRSTGSSPPSNACTNSGASGSYSHGCFYGILDTTAYASVNPLTGTQNPFVMFSDTFPNTTFQAGAGLDPRGGVWVFPGAFGTSCVNLQTDPLGSYSNCLILLDESTGFIDQGPYEMTAVLTGSGPSYGPNGAVTNSYQPTSALAVSQSTVSGTVHTYLTFSVTHRHNVPPPNGAVTTIDVTNNSTTVSPPVNWLTPEFPPTSGLALGQFAFINQGGNSSSVFFTGQYFGPEIVTGSY